jgi:hypothetical protein
MRFAELLCLFEPNVGKLYEIRRTGTSICKNKPKPPISRRLAGVPAGSSALPTPNFRPIRHDLSSDLAVGAPTDGDALIYSPYI